MACWVGGTAVHRLLAHVAATLAHAHSPFVVMPASLTAADELDDFARRIDAYDVDLLHATLTFSDTELLAAIHRTITDNDTRRHARNAALALGALPADTRIAATGKPGHHLVALLHQAIARRHWTYGPVLRGTCP